MTFVEALKTGRPMRRKMWEKWIFLGTIAYFPKTPRWRVIETGEEAGLHSYDYTASDWEVMP